MLKHCRLLMALFPLSSRPSPPNLSLIQRRFAKFTEYSSREVGWFLCQVDSLRRVVSPKKVLTLPIVLLGKTARGLFMLTNGLPQPDLSSHKRLKRVIRVSRMSLLLRNRSPP